MKLFISRAKTNTQIHGNIRRERKKTQRKICAIIVVVTPFYRTSSYYSTSCVSCVYAFASLLYTVDIVKCYGPTQTVAYGYYIYYVYTTVCISNNIYVAQE